MGNYILVTGSSSGIGREIAIRLSLEWNIILNGRNRQRLESVKSLCHEQSQVVIWEYDLCNVLNIEASLKEFIQSKNMAVIGFVHSAGYMKLLPLKSTSLNALKDTMNTNFYSAFFISKALINKTINGSDLSNIVFISSNISNFGAKAFSSYAASKSALDATMRCLAVELAPAVRVNSVLPGSIKTPMTDSIFKNPEVIERMETQYPLGLGETSDIANVVCFLLSENARWITGQQISVDGGRTINISG